MASVWPCGFDGTVWRDKPQIRWSFGVGQEVSTLIGSSFKASPRFAAFVNGVSIHADDFDDTQLALPRIAYTGCLLIRLRRFCPLRLRSQKLTVFPVKNDAAYFAGVEVETKIAEAIARGTTLTDFTLPGTCGSFGSVAASAKLRV